MTFPSWRHQNARDGLLCCFVLRHPGKKCLDIDQELATGLHDGSCESIRLPVKQEPPQGGFRVEGILLTERLAGQIEARECLWWYFCELPQLVAYL